MPRRSGTADRVVAFALSVSIGADINVGYGLTVGGALGIAAATLWVGTAAHLRQFWTVFALTALAIASGAALTLLHTEGGSVSTTDMITRSILFVSLPVQAGVLVWAAATVRTPNMVIAFGLGMLVGIPFNASSDPNAWRFTYSLAFAVAALALAGRSNRLAPQLCAIGVLAAIGFFSDSRSNSSMLMLAGVLLLVQRLVARGSRRARIWGGLGLIVVSGYVLYTLVVSAILDGVFGEVTQQRTQAQIDLSGSLILGGRPEIAASSALISRHPFGMGSGVGVSYDDLMAAKQAMWAIGYDPNNNYVERYLFGGSVEVHSMMGDFWLWFGLAGAALLVVIFVTVLGGLARDFSRTALTALFAYLAIRVIWDVLFSPATSGLRLLPLTLALAIVAFHVREHAVARPSDE